jgi:hypothetical protein
MASGTGLSYITSPTPNSGSSILGNSVLPHGAGGATHQYESKGGYPEFPSPSLSQHRKSIHKKPKSKGKQPQKHKGGSKKKSKTKKHQRRTRAK